MRRQIFFWQSLTAENVGGEIKQTFAQQESAFMSIQPYDGSTYQAYTAGRKAANYQEAIGEAELNVTDDGEHNGAIVLVGSQYFEVVQRQDWLNDVIPHFEYLLAGISTDTALELIG